MAAEFPRHPFLLSVREVEQAAGTDVDRGLTSSRAAELQQQYPPNELDVGGSIAWYTIFIRQLCNAMILVRALVFYLPNSPPPTPPPTIHASYSYTSRSSSSPWP
jgi:magnesium-transporting ATPase (P-type)